MSTESEMHRKIERIPSGRRKFTVKIMVKKKEPRKKRSPENPLQQLQEEMKVHLEEAKQHKTRIEELTKATIEELTKIHDLNKKALSLQSKNEQRKTISAGNDHVFELDYELTNLKMIKKILTLSAPFEEKLCGEKKKNKPQKKRTAPSPAKGKSRTKEQGVTSIPKILIIEDDPTTIKIITHILQQHAFEAGFTSDAEEGLKKAFKDMPDLILLDIMLPGMDGFQLLSKLQSNDATSRIPVVILSSLSGEKDILKGLEKGATDYILKPFSPQILLFKIKKILSLKNEHLADNRHV
jgi:CheY-like chemotaxis protein